MAQTLSPAIAAHLRASRYAQRERPAASIPTRISARRMAACAPAPQRASVAPALALLLAFRGSVV